MSQRVRSHSGAVMVLEPKPKRHAPEVPSSVGVQPDANGDSVDFQAAKAPPLPTLPEVRTVIMKYKPDRGSEVGRPTERLLLHVVAIDTIIGSERDPKALAQKMLESDVRTPLFRLEALLRLYEPKFGKPFEHALERVKQLEDQLGAVGFVRDALELAAKVGLPEAAVEVLKKRLAHETGKLEKLVEARWLPGKRDQVPELDDLIRDVLNAPFGSYEEDQQYLRSELSRRFEKVADKTFDFELLQEGLHEARRQQRWLPLYAHALDGAIQFSEEQNSLPALKKLLKSKEARSPFLRTSPPTREVDPIVLSKSLMVANSQVVKELGVAKDRGEYLEAFAEALHESGVAGTEKKGRAMARELLGPGHRRREFLSEGRDAYQRFAKLGVVEALAIEARGINS